MKNTWTLTHTSCKIPISFSQEFSEVLFRGTSGYIFGIIKRLSLTISHECFPSKNTPLRPWIVLCGSFSIFLLSVIMMTILEASSCVPGAGKVKYIVPFLLSNLSLSLLRSNCARLCDKENKQIIIQKGQFNTSYLGKIICICTWINSFKISPCRSLLWASPPSIPDLTLLLHQYRFPFQVLDHLYYCFLLGKLDFSTGRYLIL